MWVYNGEEINDMYDFLDSLLENAEEWLFCVVDDMLDECYEPWKFGNEIFYPSKVVKRINNGLYEEICREEKDYIISEWQYSINHFAPGANETLYELLDADYRFKDVLDRVIWVDEE